MKYVGWLWDPSLKEWVPTGVEKTRVTVSVPAYPMPTELPRPAQRLDVPGWYWNGRAGLWEERLMPPKTTWVTPVHPPEPTELPSRTQPAEVPGWRYSFMYEVWEKAPMDQVRVDVEQERPPKPAYPPGMAVSSTPAGWVWYSEAKGWQAIVFKSEIVEFTPPRSLPPGVDLASVFPADPYFTLSVETARKLVETGRWDILAQGDAYWKLVAEVHRLRPAAKFPHLIAEGVFEARAVMHAKGVWLASKEAWQMRMDALGPGAYQGVWEAGFLGVLFLVTALTGYLIGMIMERLSFPEVKLLKMDAHVTHYLLGPEHWVYSTQIGTSQGGHTYYSACERIGTEYTRHKRAAFAGEYDIIDFPGGFVEEGFVFPYFVKYTWQYWTIDYIGMLVSMGPNWYKLKHSDDDPHKWLERGRMLPLDEWCPNFKFYL